MPAKPAEKPTWADLGGGFVVTPPALKQNEGWDDAEVPVAQWQNWLHFWTAAWIDYFESVTDSLDIRGDTNKELINTLIGLARKMTRRQTRIRKEQRTDIFRAAIW